MTVQRYALVRLPPRPTVRIGAREAAGRCRVHPDFVHRLVRLGLLEPVARDAAGGEWVFGPEVVPRIRRILRLRRDLGINYAGIGVVLELLARIEHLQRRVDERR